MTDIEVLLYDNQMRGQLILALRRAIVDTFDEGDRREFAYSTGQQFILTDPRLLRSLQWNDQDYGTCVFKALEQLARYAGPALAQMVTHDKISTWLQCNEPTLHAALGGSPVHVSVALPQMLTGAEVVRRALADAENLIASSGPVSAVDRLHTALHGYLRDLCNDSGLSVSSDPTLTALFKLLREKHPKLIGTSPHEREVTRILQSFASVLDTVNTLRNHANVAHPNEVLMGEAEASLVVNATRTIFNYVVAKTEKGNLGIDSSRGSGPS